MPTFPTPMYFAWTCLLFDECLCSGTFYTILIWKLQILDCRRCHEIVGRQFVSVAATVVEFSKRRANWKLCEWAQVLWSPFCTINMSEQWALSNFSYRTNLFFFPELRPLECCRGRWGCRGSSTNGPVGMGWGKPAWNGKKRRGLPSWRFIFCQKWTFCSCSLCILILSKATTATSTFLGTGEVVQHFLVQLLFSYYRV